MNTSIITKDELLTHWLGHRALTRRTIDKFPEEELFGFHIDGMRPFSDIIKELLSIAVPGLENILQNEIAPYSHDLPYNTKSELLEAWDRSTPRLIELFNQLPEQRFQEDFNLFGEYKFPIIQNILYFIENEIHHRGQGFVYLRQLGITPPFFWERD